MTHIVAGTKKGLKYNLRCPNEDGNPRVNVYFDDPSLYEGAWSGWASQMEVGQTLTCTNHPKRSWFATVERTAEGFKVT